MDHDKPATSPLRRREEPSVDGSPTGKVEVAWTSAQCNRLLRPLSSNLAALRKLKRLESERGAFLRRAVELRVSSESDGYEISTSTAASRVEERRERLERPGAVPVYAGWDDCPGPRKRIKRTYSSKSRTRQGYAASKHTVKSLPIEMCREFKLEIPRRLYSKATRSKESLDDAQDESDTSMEMDEYGLHTFSSRPSRSKGAAVADVALGKSEYGKLISSLLLGLGALLKKTRSQTEARLQNRSAGTRSLFSTCLTMIPGYIAEEEHWSKIDNPNSEVDVSSAVYSDLENFGFSGRPGSGWKPLRTVVRFHGIHLLSGAIKEGVIGLADARSLMNLCITQDAPVEAQILLDNILSHVKSQDELVQDQSLPRLPNIQVSILDIIEEFALTSRRHGYVYQKMATLLEEDRIPTSWMSSRVVASCLNGAIESLTHECDHSQRVDDHAWQAALLLRTVARKAYMIRDVDVPGKVHRLRLSGHSTENGQPVQAVPPLVNSQESEIGVEAVLPDVENHCEIRDNRLVRNCTKILTILSAMNMLQRTRDGIHQCQHQQPCLTTLQEIGLEARQLLELSSDSETSEGSAKLRRELMALPLLAADLATMIAQQGPSHAATGLPNIAILTSLSLDLTTTKCAGSFLNDVARQAGEATIATAGRPYKRSSFKFIEIIVRYLNDVPIPLGIEIPGRKMLNDIRVAAALAFCIGGCEVANMEWALDLEQAVKMSTDATMIKTPARASSTSNRTYRWEEGIAEWVTRTPVVPPSKSFIPLPQPVASDPAPESMPKPAQTPDRRQPIGLLSDISREGSESESEPDATPTAKKGKGLATLQCVRITNRSIAGLRHPGEILAFSQDSQSSSSQSQASDSCQVFDESSNEGDSDEMSTPQGLPLHEKYLQRRLNPPLSISRQKSTKAFVQPLVPKNKRRLRNLSLRIPEVWRKPHTGQPSCKGHRSWGGNGMVSEDLEDELSMF